jgi:uncharacterized cupin superfamily protein
LDTDKNCSLAIFAMTRLSVPAAADENKPIKALKMDPAKLAGIGLAAGEPFFGAEDVLEGSHKPRGEVLHYGEELVLEVYEDDEATIRVTEPFEYDEYVWILSGKLVLTDSEGEVQEFVAGESLVVPKGFTGIWQMVGNYREFIVIQRSSYEAAHGDTHAPAAD